MFARVSLGKKRNPDSANQTTKELNPAGFNLPLKKHITTSSKPMVMFKEHKSLANSSSDLSDKFSQLNKSDTESTSSLSPKITSDSESSSISISPKPSPNKSTEKEIDSEPSSPKKIWDKVKSLPKENDKKKQYNKTFTIPNDFHPEDSPTRSSSSSSEEFPEWIPQEHWVAWEEEINWEKKIEQQQILQQKWLEHDQLERQWLEQELLEQEKLKQSTRGILKKMGEKNHGLFSYATTLKKSARLGEKSKTRIPLQEIFEMPTKKDNKIEHPEISKEFKI